jgi:serine beta-lactamase-like protein LACTB, mitochondrial
VSRDWKRAETWVELILMGIALVVAAVFGLWLYVSATARPLHPNPSDVPSVAGAVPAPRWDEAVEQGRQIVRAALAEQNLPGISVAVGAGGEIVWAEGFGWADLEKRVPVGPRTRFRIGTASIALTSAAAGLLMEQGRLKLDEEIQTYVPEFPKHQWPVTLRQLMGHVSGVPNDGGDEGPLFGAHCERPVEALQFLSGYERELLFQPGTQFEYSSYGWIAVSAAVETAAGEPFLTFMRKRIFEPLGMEDTVADSTTAASGDRATPYFPRFAADPRYGPDLMRDIDYSCYAGSSVFLSTPSDLARFGMAINSGALLQPATVQLLQARQRLASGEQTGYGLGWDFETVAVAGEQTRMAGHNGDSLGGMVASLMTVPERGIVVALTSNISYTDTEAVALKIVRAFADRVSRP